MPLPKPESIPARASGAPIPKVVHRVAARLACAVLATALCAFSAIPSRANSVVPYASVAGLAAASPYVAVAEVYTTYSAEDAPGALGTSSGYVLRVVDCVACAEPAGAEVYLQTARRVELPGGTVYVERADIALDPGGRYLVFARPAEKRGGGAPGAPPEWRAVTEHHGVFREAFGADGARYYASLAHAGPHAPRVYHADLLEASLRALPRVDRTEGAVATDVAPPELGRNDRDASPYESAAASSLPEHCALLDAGSGGGLAPRWQSTAITVYSNGFDPLVGTERAHGLLREAVGVLNANYRGVELVYGGTTAVGGQECFGDALAAGGAQSIVVVFQEEPGCDVAYGCAGGTVARGGPAFYPTRTHRHDGQEYANVESGAVIMLAGSECLSVAEYRHVLTHELTHALGFDHIVDGSANMNPQCCRRISALDIECLDYVYEPGDYRVDLLRFTGASRPEGVELEWLSAAERTNAGFEVQHTRGSSSWNAVGFVAGAGTSTRQQAYRFVHGGARAGRNYYRLRQVDAADDSEEFTGVLRVEYDDRVVRTREVPSGGGAVAAYPNPATTSVAVVARGGEPLDAVRLFDATGREVLRADFPDGPLDVGDLLPGVYQIVATPAATPTAAARRIATATLVIGGRP